VLTLLYVAGFLVAAFHRQKRGAHDMLVGSQVVYRLGPRRGAASRRAAGPRSLG
jgi:uncharacterized RDD family membrane protein YckC